MRLEQTAQLLPDYKNLKKLHKMRNIRDAEVICDDEAKSQVQCNMLPVDECSGCRCNIARNKMNKTQNKKYHRSISNNNNNLNRILTIAVVLIFLNWCDFTYAALRDVNLYVEPPAVRRGQSVFLRCSYNLEGAPLYSVKFYRGLLEFFRYTPGEFPNTKVFHYPGIKVDESESNATQVVIRNVGFGLSGNFSCEVTADAPLFSTATAYAQMQVVEFPEKRPQLFTENVRYEPGDVLRANCSTPPSRPRAELRFTINNMPVSSSETQYIRTVENLIASRLSLKLQLQPAHFSGGSNSHMINTLTGGSGGNVGVGVPYNTLNAHGSGMPTGGLVLRCTAQIGDLYQEYKEIELGTPQKDPVPARVTLSSGSGLRNFFEAYFSSSATSPTNKLIKNAVWQRQLLILSAAAAAVIAFHGLQLCSTR
ncbi:uncharacterized protein LOC119684614 [Teleopsis dalmanni]|uniref:uncharacterized protein LOC119684614 n=1 Tax=Teleopsis dalmanni TaxID=139649 RepID=UPI0018CCE94E|nr:uncharacterized protein LOC119684614 [Teleopsis dalmanni]